MSKGEIPGWLSGAKSELGSLLSAQKGQEAKEKAQLELAHRENLALWKETLSPIDDLLQTWKKLGLSKILRNAAVFYEELPFTPPGWTVKYVPPVYKKYSVDSKDLSNVLVLSFSGEVEEETGRGFLGRIRTKILPVSLGWDIVMNPSSVPQKVAEHLDLIESDLKNAGDKPLYRDPTGRKFFRNPLRLILEEYKGRWPFHSWKDFKISLWGGIYHTETWERDDDGRGYDSEEYNVFPIGVDEKSLFVNGASFPLASVDTPKKVQRIVDGQLVKKIRGYSSEDQ